MDSRKAVKRIAEVVLTYFVDMQKAAERLEKIILLLFA